MVILILIAVAILIYITYMAATKDKRAQQAAEREKQEALSKLALLADFDEMQHLRGLTDRLTDLNGPMTATLRRDGDYFILFDGDSLAIETRWRERSKDGGYEEKKDRYIYSTRTEMGKNKLTGLDKTAYMEIIKDRLIETGWMDVSEHYNSNSDIKEFRVRKKKNETIPEW
ncbi:MAG: hypothetical protein IJS31_05615 [Oscillospiraceae bacterium]|nr:hypothetical protein [Oscillospiraceae bacterium]